MMSSSEVVDLRNAGEEINGELRIDTLKLDTIESDGINLQCINSSDFMVGKQTNFNGPVTIINCADGSESEHLRGQMPGKEEVIIKEKIMTPTVAATMENFAKKKAQEKLERKRSFKYMSKGACTKKFLNVPIFVWASVLFVSFAGFVTVIMGLYLVGDDYPDDVEIFQGDGMNHTFFRRHHWKAAPEESSVLLRLPVQYVIISSTGSKNCTGLSSCATILQDIQKKQMKKTRSDIYSNFLVSGDGAIFEGRGWSKRNALQGFPNNLNIEISCIGEFVVYEHPTEPQIDAIRTLIHYGIEHGKISEDYYVMPANATGIYLDKDKPSIGNNLYKMVKGMERFESEPYSLLFPNLHRNR